LMISIGKDGSCTIKEVEWKLKKTSN
jgi:hypothetical protein